MHIMYVQYQFGCGISISIFGQESTYSKDLFLKSVDELRFVKKCPNRTFQFSMSKIDRTFSKKNSCKNINLGDHYL